MKQCEYKGCGLKHFAKGFCRKHHARLIRNGSADGLYDKSGYADLKGVLDTRPGARGYLAVNVINDIKYKAKKRQKDWQLTHQQAFELIVSSCTYCGYEPKWPENRVGIDRVSNDLGYIYDNCVPCCSTCNSAKGEKSIEDFIAWIKAAHSQLTLKDPT